MKSVAPRSKAKAANASRRGISRGWRTGRIYRAAVKASAFRNPLRWLEVVDPRVADEL
jgi:hypothetical protein